MAFFTDFAEEEAALLISLPYRVGQWISQVDNIASSQRDDEREARALEAIMKQIVKARKKAPLIAEIIQETLTYRQYWSHWAAQEATLMDDVTKAARLVKGILPDDDAAQYIKSLMQIASVVALAYGEYEGDGHALENEALFGGLFTSVMDKMNVISNEPDNISPAEQEALKKLRQALQA